MEMQQTQTVGHFSFLQKMDTFQEIRRREPELGQITTRLLPFPTAPSRQLQPQTNQRPHRQALTQFKQGAQLKQAL